MVKRRGVPEPAYLLTFFSLPPPRVKTRTLTIMRVETPWNYRRQRSPRTLRSVTDGRVRLKCFIYITILFLTLIYLDLYILCNSSPVYNEFFSSKNNICSHVWIDSLLHILLRISRDLWVYHPREDEFQFLGRARLSCTSSTILKHSTSLVQSTSYLRIFTRIRYASIHSRLRWKSCYTRCHILDVVAVLVEANLFCPNSNRHKR